MTTSIRKQLQWASELLDSISCSARLDSEVLLAHCLHKERSFLFTWPDKELSNEQLSCFQSLVRRRLKPEPIAYLVGYREFYSMPLKTTSATLVPRPETEMLVDAVLAHLSGRKSAKVLELGTGTGAIALALKKQSPICEVIAIDYSAAALEVARSNAHIFALDVQFLLSDWYQQVGAGQVYDVIVSNPPYIADQDPYLSQGDLPAEPRKALCSGATGLEALEIIVAGARDHLKAGGLLAVEHGYDQRDAVHGLFQQHLFSAVATHQDFNALDRITVGVLSEL